VQSVRLVMSTSHNSKAASDTGKCNTVLLLRSHRRLVLGRRYISRTFYSGRLHWLWNSDPNTLTTVGTVCQLSRKDD
jgi:hypothetical protein